MSIPESVSALIGDGSLTGWWSQLRTVGGCLVGVQRVSEKVGEGECAWEMRW